MVSIKVKYPGYKGQLLKICEKSLRPLGWLTNSWIFMLQCHR